ncbi:prolyl oligopeptidase family serine peptidase [Crocinitomicaceae bacterium]|nr:prolyl oligopeptidase family serine peptidase [Crocinitomicaceae bacterium]MDC0460119.1 prolyl oligopeptidase family serine peptidase [Crocinitomicaceae bacterium]
MKNLAVVLCALFIFGSYYSQNILLNEDFEGSSLPIGWSISTNASDGGWNLGTNQNIESQWWSVAPHGNIIGTNDDDCDCDKSMDYLIMPPMDFSSSVAVALQFENYYDGGSFGGDTETATLEYSFDNGSTWTVLSEIIGTDDGDWDAQSFDLSILTGNSNVLIAFHYNDNGGWMFGWAIDDVVLFEPQGLDAALSNLSINGNQDAPTTIPITGTVSNVGAEVITSFDITWSLSGGVAYTQNFSGLNLSSLATYDFTHQDTWTISQSGLYNLDVTVSNVNGQALDDNPDNDVYSQNVQALEYGTIQDGGIQREYIYYHPGSAPPNCPLVFVCHGYTGSAEGIMNYSEFNQLADEYGFAVCYPQGIEDGGGNTFFNVGYDFQNNETVDDVAYLQNLNSYFQNAYSLDADKVFCTGMSNGGDLCYMLACQASETFRGVAPIAGMIMQDIMDDCNPTSEVSILEVHGTQDNVTYFDGDPNNIDGWGAYPSIPETITFFNNLFGLQLISTEDFPNINTNDGSTVSSEKYGSSNSCTEVWLYTVSGGGHDWPGAYGNMDIEASREAWLFFDQLCEQSVGTIETPNSAERKLIKIIDLMGREVKDNSSEVFIYQYSDGTTEKKIKGL